MKHVKKIVQYSINSVYIEKKTWSFPNMQIFSAFLKNDKTLLPALHPERGEGCGELVDFPLDFIFSCVAHEVVKNFVYDEILNG